MPILAKGRSIRTHQMVDGRGERYIPRHGLSVVANVDFVSLVIPFLLETATNPTSAPNELSNTFCAVQANRSQWNLVVTMPCYSFNRPGGASRKVVEGGLSLVRPDRWPRH